MPSGSETLSPLAFVSVKSFGDLVIALTMLNRVEASSRKAATLLIGRHLVPLADALEPSVETRVLDTPLDGPAPLFDARRAGPVAALSSALQLRASIARAVAPDETLVFDTLGLRERVLLRGRQALSLPPAANIYGAYAHLLDAHGFHLIPHVPPAKSGRRVHIFAGARMTRRQPPAVLLKDIVAQVRSAGGEPQVMLLDGERPDLEHEGLPIRIVPRDFGAMLSAIREADAVISPDSMTAHLAEHARKRVLVLTPVEKFYWMPAFAAESGSILLFDENPARGVLHRFLEQALAI